MIDAVARIRRGLVAVTFFVALVLVYGALQARGAPARGGAAASVSTKRVVIYGIGYRPTHFCPDNRTCVSGFSWSIWTATAAVGRGTTRSCSTGGFDCSTVRQSMIYFRPRTMCGRLTFTRFRYSGAQEGDASGAVLGRLERVQRECHWYLF